MHAHRPAIIATIEVTNYCFKPSPVAASNQSRPCTWPLEYKKFLMKLEWEADGYDMLTKVDAPLFPCS